MDQAEKLRSIVKAHNEENSTSARVITVTSGKGGVGKSSVSINLAMQFRKLGKSVIIFDADFGLANIEVMFGAIPKYNLSDMIFRGKTFEDIIVRGPEDIGFISGGSGINGLGNMNREQVMNLVYRLRELENMADIIIIDTGAGISDSVLEFVTCSSEVLLVTTSEPTSITDAYALLKTLNVKESFSRDVTNIKVIANKVASKDEGKNLFNKLEVVVSKFLNIDISFLGVIPTDANMSKSVMQQKPISMAYPSSPATKAFEGLAQSLLEGKDVEVREVERRGLAGAVMGIFKNSKKS